MQTVPVDRIPALIGQELGVSDWLIVDQNRINAFADATLDHQFIHVDPEAARMTPWGSTIAHGFLTLSLIPYLTREIGIVPEGTVMVINYGTDKVRFLEPVKVGSPVRARVVLADATAKGSGRFLFKSKVTIEIKDNEKPALVAETLMLSVTEVPT
ncbi:MAG: MaoC family dehydratase [Acidimicrobiia bacterium]|nr:MaoC family dehydratase [Acidimicrobiia bacterium]MDH3399066.1 MaoC family dehydratase [Acidimicrobiia bacterium]